LMEAVRGQRQRSNTTASANSVILRQGEKHRRVTPAAPPDVFAKIFVVSSGWLRFIIGSVAATLLTRHLFSSIELPQRVNSSPVTPAFHWEEGRRVECKLIHEHKFSGEDLEVVCLLVEHVAAQTKSRITAIPNIVASRHKTSSKNRVIDWA
jgi:hypothetical protein